MKTTILNFLAIISFGSINAQQRGLLLTNLRTNTTLLISENKRVKIKTIDNQIFIGNFSIFNDSIISIKNDVIQLKSITKIVQRSKFSSIIRPFVIGLGTVLLSAAVGDVAFGKGPYQGIVAIVATPPGLPLFILPLTTIKHSNIKWKYEIVNK